MRDQELGAAVNRPFVLITVAVLLAHSLLGCCWHHAHASAGGGSQACAHDGHGHGHEHGNGQDGSKGEHQHTTCQEASCVFVRGDGPSPIDQSSVLSIDCPVVPASAITRAELRIVRAEYLDSQDLAPPSRLHLLHQILLI